MKAKGCKHLTYDETKYATSCSVHGLSVDNAVWERNGVNGSQLCQFCVLRGRLNSAEACTSEKYAHCSEFEMHEHEVIFREAV